MKVPLYNTSGISQGTIELSDRIFAAPFKGAVVQQVYDSERANTRLAWAHTKTRGEVRGGGKKPWKQKGLGRARHGSIRSPLWVGGGVAHGPRNERSFATKINQKTKKASVRMILSQKLTNGALVVMDAFELKEPKTKIASVVFKNFRSHKSFSKLGTHSTLLAIPREDKIIRATRNLPHVSYIEPRNMNTTALLHHRYVILDVAGTKELEKIL